MRICIFFCCNFLVFSLLIIQLLSLLFKLIFMQRKNACWQIIRERWKMCYIFWFWGVLIKVTLRKEWLLWGGWEKGSFEAFWSSFEAVGGARAFENCDLIGRLKSFFDVKLHENLMSLVFHQSFFQNFNKFFVQNFIKAFDKISTELLLKLSLHKNSFKLRNVDWEVSRK